MNQDEGLLKELEQAVIRGDVTRAEQLAKKALDEDFDPIVALEGLTNGIKIVGTAFQAQEIFLPDLMLGAKAMSAGTAILMDRIHASGLTRKTVGTLVIGTGAGDLHDIGKTIVATIFSSHGFEVKDLGIDVPSEKFIRAVEEYQPDILGISCLLTTTMPTQAEVINALERANMRSHIKVMVGGGPVTAEWAEQIGADGYGSNAIDAVKVATTLLDLN